MTKDQSICESLQNYGGDILASENMQLSKTFVHHGDTSVYAHSVGVAYVSLLLARKWKLRIDERSLVRGALLHDYFLYDWHIPTSHEGLHGFVHAATAHRNAKRDFSLNRIEENIIRRHMFPLNITPPRYKESLLVCLADKLCAVYEVFSYNYMGEFTRGLLLGE